MPTPFTVGESDVGGLDLLGFVETFDFDALMPEIRPARAPFAAACSRTALVTPVSGPVVAAADVIWEQETASPAEQTVGAGAASAVNRRVVAYVRRDQVANLGPGATITGGPEHRQQTWRVATVDHGDPDYFIATVI